MEGPVRRRRPCVRSADRFAWGTTWAQRPLLFRNIDGKHLEQVPVVEGSGLAKAMTSRGMAFGELFNDGRVVVVINNIDSVPPLFKNVAKQQNHWVAFRLVGGAKSPRDAIGATIYVTANKMRQRGDVTSGGSFDSSPDQRPHFGLGRATTIDKVEIHWPSGAVEEIAPPAVDAICTVIEGKGIEKGTPAVHQAKAGR